jgi:phosphoglycerate dehydrogenase-like enzyme
VIVLNLARPTKNDPSFYKRWEVFGKVYNKLDLTKDDIQKTEILVVDQYTIVDIQHIKLLPNLKFIASATTGHSHLKFNPSDYSFKLVTLKGDDHFLDKITSVAEFTILLMLRCARELSPNPFKLAGKRVGIVGNGRIGSQVATICESMRMKVSTYDKKNSLYDLMNIFNESDFISIHLEENEETKNMIGWSLIKAMKKNAYFINTARGSIINEIALMDALAKGKIGGAALDVVEKEIFINEHLPNLILTDHIAGRCLEDRIETDIRIIQKINLFSSCG